MHHRARSGFPDRRHAGRDRAPRSSRPTPPAAARSACAPAGTARTRAAASIRSIVTEIPYGVQKSRLIEKIAELLLAKKLPLLKDIRDESADDIRVVLEPRAGTVEPDVLMEQLFKPTELEQRIPLNMNVLDRGTVPKVMGLGEALAAWLDHRKEVLVRRTQHRLEQIARRLEVLDGYIIAYLNLDEVIRIIREEDEPKARLMQALQTQRHAGRSDPQHAAALVAQARRDRTSLRAQDIGRRADASQRAARLGQEAMGRDHQADRRPQEDLRQGYQARPSQDRAAQTPPMSISPRRPRPPSSSASRSPSCSPRRAGSAPQGPHRRDRREGLQGRRQAQSCCAGARPPTSCCCSRPAARSIRWRPTSCPAGAARASRCG